MHEQGIGMRVAAITGGEQQRHLARRRATRGECGKRTHNGGCDDAPCPHAILPFELSLFSGLSLV
jgi:hypothetical protein